MQFVCQSVGGSGALVDARPLGDEIELPPAPSGGETRVIVLGDTQTGMNVEPPPDSIYGEIVPRIVDYECMSGSSRSSVSSQSGSTALAGSIVWLRLISHNADFPMWLFRGFLLGFCYTKSYRHGGNHVLV